MKKIILVTLCWPIFQLFSTPVFAQKNKTKNETREIIIIKEGDKEKKLTIETKDGEVFINGKPSAEYKDGDVSVIKRNFQNGENFTIAPGMNGFNLNGAWDNEKTAFLGVTTEKTTDGVKITNVSKGSAAEKAGLKEGDVITKVDNRNITDPDDLSEAVRKYKPKDNLKISYRRDGSSNETKATLGERNSVRAFAFNGMGGNSNRLRNFSLTSPMAPSMPSDLLSMTYGFGRGRLGVSIEDTDDDSGVKITDVNDDSPAAKSGLKENDIITEVNGKKVKDVNEVRREIADVKDKNSYNIKARRNGTDMNFEVKIPKRLNKAAL